MPTTEQLAFLDGLLDIVKSDCMNAFEQDGEIIFNSEKTGLNTHVESGSTIHSDNGSRKLTIVINCPNTVAIK